MSLGTLSEYSQLRQSFGIRPKEFQTDLCAVPQIGSDSLLLVGDSHLATLYKSAL